VLIVVVFEEWPRIFCKTSADSPDSTQRGEKVPDVVGTHRGEASLLEELLELLAVHVAMVEWRASTTWKNQIAVLGVLRPSLLPEIAALDQFLEVARRVGASRDTGDTSVRKGAR
jgi:hypothetical protein